VSICRKRDALVRLAVELCDLLDVIIVGGLNFSRLRNFSMALVADPGSQRLGNLRRCRSGGGTVSAEGAER
jgi:hypothetical protein